MGRKPNAWYIEQGLPVPGAMPKPAPAAIVAHDPLLLEVIAVLRGGLGAMRWGLPPPAQQRVTELIARLDAAGDG